MKPTGENVAKNALGKVGKIAYDEQDCQAFVEGCVKDCGGKMDYAGSNDMFRNACAPLPIDGTPPVGALLFIHALDGGEPERYKADGKGNASHVGIYAGNGEAVHSSKSKGGVVVSPLKGGWTHFGLAKEIDYGGQGFEAEVLVSSVNFRKAPSTKADLFMRILRGEKLRVLETTGEWARVCYRGIEGYVMREFISEKAPEKVQITLDYTVAAALFDALGERL